MVDQLRLKNVIFTQGPTTLLVTDQKAKIASRGATIEFNTMDDLLQFANELNIIMVELAQKKEEMQGNLTDESLEGEPRS